jgi:hypothetical protein
MYHALADLVLQGRVPGGDGIGVGVVLVVDAELKLKIQVIAAVNFLDGGGDAVALKGCLVHDGGLGSGGRRQEQR